MEQNIVFYIGIYKFLGLIVTAIGGVAVSSWYIGSKLGGVGTKVDNFENRLTNLEGRLDLAFASSSPIALLAKGIIILEKSGLKKYIDDRKDELFAQCCSKNSMNNPYDIQEVAFKFLDQLSFGDFEPMLKAAAFKHGVSIDTIRRIGGIYFRDICLAAKGFKPEDLDKPQSN